jgi:hypothetical protein
LSCMEKMSFEEWAVGNVGVVDDQYAVEVGVLYTIDSDGFGVWHPHLWANLDKPFVALLAERAKGPGEFLPFGLRGSGWEMIGLSVLSEGELTIPGQACGGEVGDIEFDRSARFDRVDEESFDFPRLGEFAVPGDVGGACVLGRVFIGEIGVVAKAELLAAL